MRASTLLLLSGAMVGIAGEVAEAGPCTQQIVQFERAVRESAVRPTAGPTARETVGAKLGHQPTARSVELARRRADLRFAAIMAQAKASDARGNGVACRRALARAKAMFEFQ
jgi:hypothetical protein